MLKIIFMSYVTFVNMLLQSILKEVTSNFKVSMCLHSTLHSIHRGHAPEIHGEDVGADSAELHHHVGGVRLSHDLEILH